MNQSLYFFFIFLIYSFFSLVEIILTPFLGMIFILSYLSHMANIGLLLCRFSKRENICSLFLQLLIWIFIALKGDSSYWMALFLIIPLIFNIILMIGCHLDTDNLNRKIILKLYFIFFAVNLVYPCSILFLDPNHFVAFIICSLLCFPMVLLAASIFLLEKKSYRWKILAKVMGIFYIAIQAYVFIQVYHVRNLLFF